MRKIIIDNEKMVEIIKMYKDGLSFSYIEKITNINRKKIAKEMQNVGLYTPNKNHGKRYDWESEEIKLIVSEYNKGKIPKQIAKIFHCDETVIFRILKDEGIDTSRKRISHNFKKYNLNEDYFNLIDNQRKAYWLGFIVADGHISADGKLMIAIQKRDSYLLDEFLKDIESNHPVTTIKNNKSINIGSSKMVNCLRDKGLNNRKSYYFESEKLFSCVPKHLLNHFIRGYFDGDGCIGIYKQTYYEKPLYHFSLVGIECFLLYVMNIMSDIKFTLKYDKRTVSTYELKCRNKEGIINIRDFLYKDANIYLKRKHEKFYTI